MCRLWAIVLSCYSCEWTVKRWRQSKKERVQNRLSGRAWELGPSESSCESRWISLSCSLAACSTSNELSITCPYMQDSPICCYLPSLLQWIPLLSSCISFPSILSNDSQCILYIYIILFFFFFNFQFWSAPSDRPCIHPAVAPVLMSLPRHASSSHISFQPLSTADLNNVGIFWESWERQTNGRKLMFHVRLQFIMQKLSLFYTHTRQQITMPFPICLATHSDSRFSHLL